MNIEGKIASRRHSRQQAAGMRRLAAVVFSACAVFGAAADTGGDALLAEYLAAGRFVDFRLAPAEFTVLTTLPEIVS